MRHTRSAWGVVGSLGFACGTMGQGVITHLERAIEQVFDPDPAITLNCDKAADLDLAVGPNRIVYTSNCLVRLVDPAAPGVALDEVYLRNHQEDDPPGLVVMRIVGGRGDEARPGGSASGRDECDIDCRRTAPSRSRLVSGCYA